MKKALLIFMFFCFIFISCPNKPAVTTEQDYGILNDKVFYLGELEDDGKQKKYYLYFLDGIEYGIEYYYSGRKFKTGNSFKGTTIYDKDGTIYEVTVSNEGITFPNGRFAPMVTDPELLKTIKNLPVIGDY